MLNICSAEQGPQHLNLEELPYLTDLTELLKFTCMEPVVSNFRFFFFENALKLAYEQLSMCNS